MNLGQVILNSKVKTMHNYHGSASGPLLFLMSFLLQFPLAIILKFYTMFYCIQSWLFWLLQSLSYALVYFSWKLGYLSLKVQFFHFFLSKFYMQLKSKIWDLRYQYLLDIAAMQDCFKISIIDLSNLIIKS